MNPLDPPRPARVRRLLPCVLGWVAVLSGCSGSGAVPSATGAVPSATGAALASAPATSALPSAVIVFPTPARASADTLLARTREAYGAPGALAVVDRAGTRTLASSGTADTSGTQITETTRFRIASITKPVTAALVLDAVARNQVTLDMQVGDLLPGLLKDPPVTVRQLLEHSSGIFDEINGVSSQAGLEADIKAIPDPVIRAEAAETLRRLLAGERAIASARVIVALSETHPRYFPPGRGYHYSNTNFQLAAMVLEKATGESFASLLQRRVASPLNLSHTTIAPPDTSTPDMHGYVPGRDGSLLDVSDDLALFGNGGNGGILSTGTELNTMLRSIVRGSILSERLREEMLTPTGGHGLGIGAYPFSCGLFWGHQGGTNGTASIALVGADSDASVVAVLNLRKQEDPDMVGLARDLVCGA